MRNWLALRPEERWWLFGMTAVASSGIEDGENGWRVALRNALGDVAENDFLRSRRLDPRAQERPQQASALFDD